MFTLITPEKYRHFETQMDEMYALRYRVFSERLNWVEGEEGQEKDAFDDLSPSYLVYQDTDGHVAACVRMLPTTGKNMLRDTFPELMDGKPVPVSEQKWESSRFAVDTQRLKEKGELGNISNQLFLAMIEFGLSRRLNEIVTVTDMRVERIVRHSGWGMRRLGNPKKIGDTRAVAIAVEISQKAWNTVKNRANINNPVLYEPVI